MADQSGRDELEHLKAQPLFRRFTDNARKAMALANQEAQRVCHERLGSEHILLGVVKVGAGIGPHVLRSFDVDLNKVRNEVRKLVGDGPLRGGIDRLPLAPSATEVLENAMAEAQALHHNYVGTEHMLLGLLREQDSVAAQVLKNLGLNLEALREAVLNAIGVGPNPESRAAFCPDSVTIGRERYLQLQELGQNTGTHPAELARQAIDEFLKRHDRS